MAPECQARPVNPTSLSTLPSFAPIRLGHHYTLEVSPDLRTLAAIVWPSGSHNRDGVLHLIDLESWTDISTDVRLGDYVADVTFSPDQTELYWTIPTTHDSPHGLPRDYQLQAYNIKSHQLSVISQFASQFTPWMQRTISGKVAIIGLSSDSDNLAEDVPHVMIVDPVQKRVSADLQLEDVKAGQFREKATNETSSGQEDAWRYVNYRPGLAWDVEHSALYIAHADTDQVTIADLANGSIKKLTSIRPSTSILEWILAASTAEAKGGPTTQTRAILDPDGRLLFVASQGTASGGPGTMTLRVIATEEMRVIGHIDRPLTDFTLMPDGKSLLVINDEGARPLATRLPMNRTVQILDAATLQERASVSTDEDDLLGFVGASPDSRYAYLRGASALLLLDLESKLITSTHEFAGSFDTLLRIGP